MNKQDSIANVGYIDSMNTKNVMILNELDAVMYDELYHFKQWPSIEYDIVSEKLSNDNNMSFEKVYRWMNDWQINDNTVQFIIVRTDLNLYTVYCNYFEAMNYFRKYVLKHDIILISTNIKSRQYNRARKSTNTPVGHIEIINPNTQTSEYVENPNLKHYHKIINFLDLELKKYKYSYSYIPERQRNGSVISVLESRVYMIDRLESHCMNKLDQLKNITKQLNDEWHDDDDDDETFGFLDYGNLPSVFGKYPHTFWNGGL